MQKIGVVSRKGGTWKTTLVVRNAIHFAARGEKVLVVDCDVDQYDACYWLMRKEDFEALESGRINKTRYLNVDCIWVFEWKDFPVSFDAYDLVLFDGRPSGWIVTSLAPILDFAVIPYHPNDLRMAKETEVLLRKVNATLEIRLVRCGRDIPFNCKFYHKAGYELLRSKRYQVKREI